MIIKIALSALFLASTNCAHTGFNKASQVAQPVRDPASINFPGYVQITGGVASMYADSLSGNLTASGARFSPIKLTAAHPSLPFGTVVKVVHARTFKSVDVVVNDRGPYAHGRVIDLSRAAASAVGIENTVGPVLLFVKKD